jgi:thiol-disulfide isomerase/thioredoxin
LGPVIEAKGRDTAESAAIDGTAPEPFPPGVVAGARSVSSEAYAPINMSDPEPPIATAKVPQRTARSNRPAARPAPTNVPSQNDRPTWGELSFQKPEIPLDESLKRVSRDVTARSAQHGQIADTAGSSSKLASLVPATATTLQSKTGSSCQFDPTDHHIYDFQLPDTSGRITSLHDFDADVILLDFWGTWCAPCRKSIPHLNELQKTLGGKKLQVIGIACERALVKDRAGKVSSAVKDLKITYPVLVSGMDGTCPVQDALQIQFYPTMVLLDRQGRILWREQGATEVTLARMDRFIARSLHLSPPGESYLEPARAIAVNPGSSRVLNSSR